jgi:NitT/TauT family transport system substrate-binding protein
MKEISVKRLWSSVVVAWCVAGFVGAQDLGADAELVETRVEVPKLKAAETYAPKDGVVEIELSEYAGYAGLIVANGGLEPNDASIFAKKHGFKLKISLSEEESWSALNSGRIAASATTADVLAAYGRQFKVTVPAQIGFSRGADGIVVRKEIRKVNDLKGKVLATAQFTEADFFVRYLAQEAGIGVNALPDLKTAPAPDKINLVYCGDAFGAGDLFLRDLTAGRTRLAGCVTWAPKTSEVAEASGGKAVVLVTNRNLLIVADVLIVNKGFADQNANVVAGLVHGLYEGNRVVREDPNPHLAVIAKAFGWTPEKAKTELSKVHLSNVPEAVGFFKGSLTAAGSFGSIYSSAVFAYGEELIGKAAPAERFLDVKALEALGAEAPFKDQKPVIVPIGKEIADVEGSPLLSKDIRFYYAVNSSDLDPANPDNAKNLESIREMLRTSPGSVVNLVGHVDPSRREEFSKQGAKVLREMTAKSDELSKSRADAVRNALEKAGGVDMKRVLSEGRGWNEPVSKTNPDANRRVEVQWFTVE